MVGRIIEQVLFGKKVLSPLKTDEESKGAFGNYPQNIGYHFQCFENKAAFRL
jgi:hypothetical protein